MLIRFFESPLLRLAWMENTFGKYITGIKLKTIFEIVCFYVEIVVFHYMVQLCDAAVYFDVENVH